MIPAYDDVAYKLQPSLVAKHSDLWLSLLPTAVKLCRNTSDERGNPVFVACKCDDLLQQYLTRWEGE